MCIGNNSSKMKQMWDGFLVAMYVFSPGKVRLRKAMYLSQQLTLEFVVKLFKIVIPWWMSSFQFRGKFWPKNVLNSYEQNTKIEYAFM